MVEIGKLWREPLVHFLIIGAAFFLVFELTQEQGSETPKRIFVDANQVEQLAAQFKRTWMRPPTEEELAGLTENHVRDEVYYREALAMGLDQNDPQVRRRMRLKLEFILEDLTAGEPPGDAVLTAYLQQHPDRFQAQPQVSFRQLYLNPDKRQDLVADAQAMLASLNAGATPDSVADTTLLQQEYVLATPREIARSFGEAFALEVVKLAPGDWIGPLYSGLGGHLVKVSERVEGRLPALAEIRSQVEREYLARRRQELKDMAYQKLREGYQVIVESPTPTDGAADEAVAGETAQAGR